MTKLRDPQLLYLLGHSGHVGQIVDLQHLASSRAWST
jgi:hypothetical protein